MGRVCGISKRTMNLPPSPKTWKPLTDWRRRLGALLAICTGASIMSYHSATADSRVSLKQEHQTAIQCFERAVQVDPHYDYAYTLLGHEYMAIEDLEKAVMCFGKARSRNPRSFNAWYVLSFTEQIGDHSSISQHALAGLQWENCGTSKTSRSKLGNAIWKRRN